MRLERSIELWLRRSHAERLNQFQSGDGRMRSGMQIRLAAKGGAELRRRCITRSSLLPPQTHLACTAAITDDYQAIIYRWPPSSGSLATSLDAQCSCRNSNWCFKGRVKSKIKTIIPLLIIFIYIFWVSCRIFFKIPISHNAMKC